MYAILSIMVDALYFIFRYIPWWSVPSIFISLHFANIYFAKEMKNVAWFFTFYCIVSLLAIAWYIYAGSPRGSVLLLQKILKIF